MELPELQLIPAGYSLPYCCWPPRVPAPAVEWEPALYQELQHRAVENLQLRTAARPGHLHRQGLT